MSHNPSPSIEPRAATLQFVSHFASEWRKWANIAQSSLIAAMARIAHWVVAPYVLGCLAHQSTDTISLLQMQHLLFFHIVLLAGASACSRGCSNGFSGLVAQAHGAASLQLMHAWLLLQLVVAISMTLLLLLVCWSVARYLLSRAGYNDIDCNIYSRYVACVWGAVTFDAAIVILSSYFTSFQDGSSLTVVSLIALLIVAGALQFFADPSQLDLIQPQTRDAIYTRIAWIWTLTSVLHIFMLAYLLRNRLQFELLFFPKEEQGVNVISLSAPSHALQTPQNEERNHNENQNQHQHIRLLQVADSLISKLEEDSDGDDGDEDTFAPITLASDAFSQMEVELSRLDSGTTSRRRGGDYSLVPNPRPFIDEDNHESDEDSFDEEAPMQPTRMVGENKKKNRTYAIEDRLGQRSVEVFCLRLNIDYDKIMPSRHYRHIVAWFSRPRVIFFLRHHVTPSLAAAFIRCFGMLVFFLVLSVKLRPELKAERTQVALLLAYGAGALIARHVSRATAVRVGFLLGRGDATSAKTFSRLYLLSGMAFGSLLGLLVLCFFRLVLELKSPVLLGSEGWAGLEGEGELDGELRLWSVALFIVVGAGCGLWAGLLEVLGGQGRATDQLTSIFYGTWLVTIPLFFIILFLDCRDSSSSLSSSGLKVPTSAVPSQAASLVSMLASLSPSLSALDPTVTSLDAVRAAVWRLWLAVLLGDLVTLLLAKIRARVDAIGDLGGICTCWDDGNVGEDGGHGDRPNPGLDDWEADADQVRDRISNRIYLL
jgi:Na+-driven multidrug efflux pump